MTPEDTHRILEPIYEHALQIKEEEPEKAERIVQICLELNIAINLLK